MRFLLLAWFLVLAPSQVLASSGQASAVATGSVRGVVASARTNEALADVLVECQATGQAVVSATDGSFELGDVPAGEQTLYVSVVGYALARPTVTVVGGSTAVIRIPLAEGTGAYTERITVSAGHTAEALVPPPATQVLTSAGLQELRGVLADDPFRAVQALPGVATGDDFRSEFSVRGSDFRHLGLSIEGVASRWLVHTVRGVDDTGSISLLNGDVLEQITLLSGVYPQRFGNRTGAWMESDIREGSRDARAVRVSLSGTGASLVMESPIGRRRRGAWLVSVRQSYLDWLLRHITDENGIVFGFSDLQAKGVYDLTDRHRIDVTLVAGRSKLTEESASPGPNTLRDGRSRTALLTGRLRSTVGETMVFDQRLAVIGGDFHNHGFFEQVLGSGRVSEASYQLGVSWSPSSRLLMDAGGRVVRESMRADRVQYGLLPGLPDTFERSRSRFTGTAWRASAQAGARWTGPGGVGLHPGVLFMRHQLTGETNVAPWLVANWPLTSRIGLRGGAGASQQAPEVEHVLGPNGRRDLQSESARQFDLGLEATLGKGATLTVSGYARHERDFLRLEGVEPRMVSGQVVLPPLAARFQNALSGDARGVEFVVRRSATRGLSGWASYTFGLLRYHDHITNEAFWGDFDQRHALSLYGLYPLSPRTSVSAKFRMGSNFPLAGYFDSRDDTLFVGERRNTVRLPAYARLDLRANRTFNYSKRRLTLFVEVLNVLNRTNLGPTDGDIGRTGEAPGWVEELLPVLPSAGLTIEF